MPTGQRKCQQTLRRVVGGSWGLVRQTGWGDFSNTLERAGPEKLGPWRALNGIAVLSC
jgi:hypothetical protein